MANKQPESAQRGILPPLARSVLSAIGATLLANATVAAVAVAINLLLNPLAVGWPVSAVLFIAFLLWSISVLIGLPILLSIVLPIEAQLARHAKPWVYSLFGCGFGFAVGACFAATGNSILLALPMLVCGALVGGLTGWYFQLLRGPPPA